MPEDLEIWPYHQRGEPCIYTEYIDINICSLNRELLYLLNGDKNDMSNRGRDEAENNHLPPDGECDGKAAWQEIIDRPGSLSEDQNC